MSITKKIDTLNIPRWEENSMLQSFFRLKLWCKCLSIQLIDKQLISNQNNV